MSVRMILPALLVIALATPALAAPTDPHHPQGAGAPSAQTAQPGMMGIMQGMCPMMGRAEGTLAFLKTELKITAAQDSAWNTFASAYREVAATRGEAPMGGSGMMMGGGMMGDGNAMMSKPFPDRMAMHTQMMERRLAASKKLQAAAQPLYAALDASQKKTADQLLPMTVMMAGM